MKQSYFFIKKIFGIVKKKQRTLKLHSIIFRKYAKELSNSSKIQLKLKDVFKYY